MLIEIYSKKGCPFCTRATTLLDYKRHPYTEKVLGEDFTREILLEKYPSATTYPVIVIDGMYIGGFAELETYYNILNEEDQKKFLAESKK